MLARDALQAALTVLGWLGSRLGLVVAGRRGGGRAHLLLLLLVGGRLAHRFGLLAICVSLLLGATLLLDGRRQ